MAQTNYYGVAPEFVGSVMLYVGSVACQQNNLMLRNGWSVPLLLDMIIVAQPGEKKSAIQSENVRPIDEYVREWNAKNKDEITKSRVRKEYLKRWKDKLSAEAVKSDDKSIFDEAERLAIEYANYKEMTPLRVYTSDCTIERLVMLMAEQGGIFNVISSEGAFINNICGLYSGVPNADAVLKGFDCDSIEVDRVNRAGEVIENPRFSFLQCIQPVVYQKLASNSVLKGQGLVDRCLLCYPASSIGKMKFEAPAISDKLRIEYDNMIEALLRRRNEKRCLRLDADARALFGQFADDFNQNILMREFSEMTGAGAKHVGIIGRVCGVLQLLEDPDAEYVTRETVEKAIRLSEYYREQLKLIHDGHILNTEETLAKYLRDKIISCCEKGKISTWTDGTITLKFRDLNRSCNKSELRKKDDFAEPLKVLQGMNYIDFPDANFSTIQINPTIMSERG